MVVDEYQHELDPWSLMFGVAFLVVAGSYLLSHTTSARLHWLLVLPAALIVVGVGVLAGSVRRMQRSQRGSDGDQSATSTTTGA